MSISKYPRDIHFWCEREEEYLQLLHKTCLELVTVYKKMYIYTSQLQNKLRLPAIILSSLSGAASFGSSSFASWSSDPGKTQKYINVSIGLVNVFIAMIQTYETFKKVGDILSKSLSTSISLKKLAEDIHCVIFIPSGDRETAGILYLRDTFNKYQSIMEQAPPLEHSIKDYLKFEDISEKIKLHVSSNRANIEEKEKNRKRHNEDYRSTTNTHSDAEHKIPISPRRNHSRSIESYSPTSIYIDNTTNQPKNDDVISNVDSMA